MYTINSGKDKPKSGAGRNVKYPFAYMNALQSFDVPVKKGDDYAKIQVNILTASRRHEGKFSVRYIKAEKLVRCWRDE